MDLTAASVIGLLLALAAALLLARDVRRAWRDPWRRPITLLAAALIALLLIGTLMERDHPHPGWLFLPAGVLVWEVARGWRRAPRCHLWEGEHRRADSEPRARSHRSAWRRASLACF